MALEGQQLGRYRLQQLLGTGGMGEVYLATDTVINRQVAIKVIRSEVSAYPDADVAQESARLFQREMKAIAMLDHPHIMPLFDYGEATVNGANLAFLVMPYRQEGSLATWLKQRPSRELLSPQDVAKIVSQAADALQHAHDRAIIHQDVKPANFLIRRVPDDPDHPELLLADFGVSKFSSATANASQSIRGTPASMAPEQWEGAPVPATDQYALAVMAYELLTGRPPFQGGLSQLMYQHFNTAPPPPSSFNPRLSHDIDTVLLHALAKKPGERFASIAAFGRAFQQAVANMQPASGNLPGRTYEAAPGSNPTPQFAASPPPQPSQQVAPSQWAGSDIQAVLAISVVEAASGTTRTLTLPDGRRVVVRVPAGAFDGQRISVQESGGPGAPPLTLTLALAVMQANAPDVPDTIEHTMRASNPDLAPPKTPSPTPWLGQEQVPIPPPPPGFQPSWTPPPNPPLQSPVPSSASWTPQNLDTHAPTIQASNPNLQQQTVSAFASSTMPAAPPTPPKSSGRGAKLRNAVLAGLALLLILGGLGIFTLVHNEQVASAKANATATAQALARANASATALSENTTATAEANAIATQAAINSGQATATAVAYQNLYTSSTSGTPAFNDPLSDNSRGNGWSEGTSTGGGGCQFTGGVYHATTPNNTFFESCDATAASFSNFAYSVKMKIVKGDCGGMLFREADLNNGKFYYWRVCQDGSYILLLYTNNTAGTAKTLRVSSIASFNTGRNASNLLTVIVKGQSIYLYVNKQLVDSVIDGTYSQGQFGVSADSLGNWPTDVAYTNAEVWKL